VTTHVVTAWSRQGLVPMVARGLTQLWLSPWLLCFVAAFLLLGLGAVPLFDLDEGAFSAATMEMLQRGDYITTYLGSELRFDKPILIYWLQAVSVSSLGLNEFALRLPSALCASLWCTALWFFVRSQLDASRAASAVILLASSLVFAMIARAATADALLNLFIALALFDAYRALTLNEPAARWIRWRAYLWVGLGVLAKGPVAILLPLAITNLFSLCTHQWRPWWRLLWNPLGWLIAALVFVPWYLAEYAAQGQAFVDGFILKHNLGRFSSTMEGHGGHWYYYLPVSLLVFMPASGFFVQLLVSARKWVSAPLDWFCLCWFGFVLVFFSVSNTQLPHYLLYGATPVFILLARHRERLTKRWLLLLPALTLLLVFLLLPEIAARVIATSHKVELVAMLQSGLPALDGSYRAGVLLALIALLVFGWVPHLAIWQRQLWISVIFTITFVHCILPTYGAIQQQPVRAAAQFARQLPQTPVMWRQDMPSFSVYLGRVVPIRTPLVGELVFTGLDQRAHLPAHELLFAQGGVIIVRLLAPIAAAKEL
jgi:hypothetical protein